jgi:hypothetical protein
MITAACHLHSDWSYDGKWTLADLAEEFGSRGYSLLMTTEHDRGFTEARRLEHRAACAAASSAGVRIVSGLEYSDAENRVHILVWGPVPFVGEGVPTRELLAAVKAAKGIAVMAHPTRLRAWEAYEPAWADDLLGIEVWNRKTDGWAPSRTAIPLMYGTRLFPFVGTDFHDRRQRFPLSMALDCPPGASEEAVLDYLRGGRCQAMAFGRPLGRSTGGWVGSALRGAERCRRGLARAVRAGTSRRTG